VLFEETTGTLLCGDLFTHLGDGPAVTEADVVGPAQEAENIFNATFLAPSTRTAIECLAALEPQTLAIMHGSAFRGDGGSALRDLAKFYGERAQAQLPG
jgi:hypothetical protein